MHNETRLANEIALRTEVGYDVGLSINSLNDTNIFIVIPSVRAEPRWYYNLTKRSTNGKNIHKNSGNFVALNSTWNPDFFVISNDNLDAVNVISTISIIPKWGIKRTYGNHFTFETGIGLGYVFYLEEYNNESGGVGLDLHLRFGYTF